ncbi:YhjD/YihY/BrkB family envelope integrity protein [Halomarina litorea]|uniref:YhjD/YihY/BrkB family envelope integrity protein n=1 Tax=Halomarina litorea TaxID=2961595 RepID=UPI0020C4ACC7|nr:YhjD/YihY/BrkB family envelope integrity protein [Halomarina sp. BCD28]
MFRVGSVLSGALTVVRVATEHDIRYPAAALAYYSFVSLLPLVVLVLALVGAPIATEIQAATPRVLTTEAQQLMYEALTTATGRAGAALLAAAVLAWSAANISIGFLTVIERVEAAGDRSLLDQARDATGILGSLLLAIAALVVVGALFPLIPASESVAHVGFLVLPLALTAAFVPLYYVPSRLVTSVRAALPGAVSAALGWTVLLLVVQVYATNAGRYAVYGVLSGIIIILTALYAAATMLLFGVVVNALVARRGALEGVSE